MIVRQDLNKLCVNMIRMLAADAVQQAKSGHPGMPMGAAAMAYVLWTRFLKHNPANPKWPDRDRFVLSPGHGSMLLYSLLYLTGYGRPVAGGLRAVARADETEAAWSLVTAILQEWQASGAKGLATYAAGSWGPRVAEVFIERDRRQWARL